MSNKMVYRPQRVTAQLIERVSKRKPPDRPREIRDARAGLILRHQPSGYLSLYAELGRGKRERICDAADIPDKSKSLTMARARELARIARGESTAGRDFSAERKAERAIPTLRDFLDKNRGDSYAAWVIENRKSGQMAVDRIKSRLDKHLNKKLDTLTPALIDAWITKRRRNVTAETCNRDVGTLKAALSKAAEWRIIPVSPLRDYKPLKVDRHKRTQRPLTEAEIDRLRDALAAREERIRDERQRGNLWRMERGYTLKPSLDGVYVDNLLPAVELSLATGARRGELLALDWKNIDLKRRTATFQGDSTKSYQTRRVPLNDHVAAIMRAWKLQHGRPAAGPVFPGPSGHVADLKKSYHAVLEAAEIERETTEGRATWHSLRHTFGTRLGAAGVDPQTLRELMGHADLKTTQRYLKTDDDRRRDAVARLV